MPRNLHRLTRTAPLLPLRVFFVGSAVFVYAIGYEESTWCYLVKIGKTNNVRARKTALQTACPFDLRIFGARKLGEGSAGAWEAALHHYFAGRRMRGEWFALSRSERELLLGYLEDERCGAEICAELFDEGDQMAIDRAEHERHALFLVSPLTHARGAAKRDRAEYVGADR